MRSSRDAWRSRGASHGYDVEGQSEPKSGWSVIGDTILAASGGGRSPLVRHNVLAHPFELADRPRPLSTGCSIRWGNLRIVGQRPATGSSIDRLHAQPYPHRKPSFPPKRLQVVSPLRPRSSHVEAFPSHPASDHIAARARGYSAVARSSGSRSPAGGSARRPGARCPWPCSPRRPTSRLAATERGERAAARRSQLSYA